VSRGFVVDWEIDLMLRTVLFVVGAAAIAVLPPLAPAQAASCLGVTLDDSTTVGGQTLVLNGTGPRLATFLKVKVYAAGLYLPVKATDAAAILGADGPWQLQLHFVRAVEESDISGAWSEGFEANAADGLDALKPRIDQLNGMMQDIGEGDVMTFTYLPGQGTEVAVNGTVKGTVEGADFGRELLAIWLGEPPNSEIKAGLLGGGC
jgi:hypothetical protein